MYTLPGKYKTAEIQGNVVVITGISHANTKPRVRRLSKDEYLNVGTGEICRYEHKETRAENKTSLLRSFAAIRGIVNANAEDPETVRFATLTYKENMTDPKQLYRDFKSFWLRLKRWHKREGLPEPKYLLVVEPQERGAWHGHLLLFYGENKAPFIPNETLAELWRHGFTKITAVDKVDNLGAYLSAYLTDVAVDAEPGDEDAKTIDGERKSIIKGGRLHRYPTGMNLYRHSQGLKMPEKFEIDELAAKMFRDEYDPTYSTQRTFTDNETGYEVHIYKEWYNLLGEPKEGLETAFSRFREREGETLETWRDDEAGADDGGEVMRL